MSSEGMCGHPVILSAQNFASDSPLKCSYFTFGQIALVLKQFGIVVEGITAKLINGKLEKLLYQWSDIDTMG